MAATRTGEVTVHEAILRAMASIGSIAKGSRNERQNFTFRGIDDIVPPVQQALIEQGITVIPRVTNVTGGTRKSRDGNTLSVSTVHISFLITGPDGSFVEASMTGEAADSGDKSMSKAISMATKYFLFYTFWIPVSVNTGDGDAYEYGSKSEGPVASSPLRQARGAGATGPKAAIASASARTTGSAATTSGDGITEKQVGLVRRLGGLQRTDIVPDWLLNDASEVVGRVVDALDELSKREGSALIDFLQAKPDEPQDEEDF